MLWTVTIAWYGGGTRSVGIAHGTGHRYKAGEGLLGYAWIFVRDRIGPPRDEYVFSTDPGMSPVAMVEAYTGRWDLETFFQELRRHLGLETTRCRCRRMIPRAAPCLFGLDAAVVLLCRALSESRRAGSVDWPGKAGVTSSHALTAMRRRPWRERAFFKGRP